MKAANSEGPVVRVSGGAFILEEAFKYHFPWKPAEYVVVPEGYKTNFASIPWAARWLVSPIDETILIAALIHDWLVQEFGEE